MGDDHGHRFAGKAVIVTGSSAGIGQATALLFAKEGAQVTIHGRSEAGLSETERLLDEAGIPHNRVHRVQGDLTDDAVIKALVDETIESFGRIDCIVANAGIGNAPDTDPLNVKTLDYLLQVNLVSGVKLLQLAEPHLEKRHGNVIYVSSVASTKTFAANPFYAVSKAALDHWVRQAAVIYGAKNIRVNTLNPGIVKTQFVRRLGAKGEAIANHIETDFAEKVVPLKRASEAIEQAEAILFLAGENARYITAANLVVDGGISQVGANANLDFKP